MPQYLTVYAPGHIDPADSYGYIAGELVRHLHKLGVHANAIALGNPVHENQDPELSQLTSRPITWTKGGILLGYPTVHKSYGTLANEHPKIAITMFESSKIPESWIDPLNECDAVIVPCHFCADVFRDCGVWTPIYMVPLGVHEIYTHKERSLDGPFTFLTFLDRGRRKGGFLALEAFVSEFKDDPNVHLLVKHREVPEFRKLVIQNENIDVIYGDYTAQEMRDLYWKCHCLVNPHKGEGFGLIPREFAATGGISLTTAWSGTQDLLNLWGWPIDYDLEVADWKGAKSLEGRDLGMWAAPKMEDIQRRMRDIYENRESLLRAAKLRGSFARQYYKWSEFANMVHLIWETCADGYRNPSKTPPTSRRILIDG